MTIYFLFFIFALLSSMLTSFVVMPLLLAMSPIYFDTDQHQSKIKEGTESSDKKEMIDIAAERRKIKNRLFYSVLVVFLMWGSSIMFDYDIISHFITNIVHPFDFNTDDLYLKIFFVLSMVAMVISILMWIFRVFFPQEILFFVCLVIAMLVMQNADRIHQGYLASWLLSIFLLPCLGALFMFLMDKFLFKKIRSQYYPRQSIQTYGPWVIIVFAILFIGQILFMEHWVEFVEFTKIQGNDIGDTEAANAVQGAASSASLIKLNLLIVASFLIVVFLLMRLRRYTLYYHDTQEGVNKVFADGSILLFCMNLFLCFPFLLHIIMAPSYAAYDLMIHKEYVDIVPLSGWIIYPALITGSIGCILLLSRFQSFWIALSGDLDAYDFFIIQLSLFLLCTLCHIIGLPSLFIWFLVMLLLVRVFMVQFVIQKAPIWRWILFTLAFLLGGALIYMITIAIMIFLSS